MTFINTCSTKANYQPNHSEFYVAMSFVLEIRTKTTAKQQKVASIYPPPLFCGEAFFSGNPCTFFGGIWTCGQIEDVCFSCNENKNATNQKKQVQKLHTIPEKASSFFFPVPPQKNKKMEWRNTSILWPPRKTSWFPSILRCAFTSSFGLATWLPLPSASFLWAPGDWDERFVVNFVEPISPVILTGHTLVNEANHQ